MWKDPLKIVNHHLANITDTKEEVADGFSRSFKAVQPCSFLGFVYVFNQSFSTNRFQQIINIGGKIQAGNIQEKTTNKNNCIHKYLIKSLLLQAQDWLPGVWSYRRSSQRLICPRGKKKMPSAYVKFDGHMTISGIFGNEQFPVVN